MPGTDAVGQVVMDEFHFYADPPARAGPGRSRCSSSPRTQFLLMSATLGGTSFFSEDLERRTGSLSRPSRASSARCPLTYSYIVEPLHGSSRSSSRPAAHRSTWCTSRRRTPSSGRSRSCRPPGLPRAALTGSPTSSGTSASAPASARRSRDSCGTVSASTTRGCSPKYRRVVERLLPARAAHRRLRDGHPRRRDQRADPHRRVHLARQVRRHEDAAPERTRVPPDRRAGRPCRVRHARRGR